MADTTELLAAAVAALGGVEREGQSRMVRAVTQTFGGDGPHLLVQAGTGTGKSLGYLVPAVEHAVGTRTPVVVATATLALQAQLLDRELPLLARSLDLLLGRPPTFAVLKGRRNYVCRHKLDGGFPDDEDALLGVAQVDAAVSRLGAQVVRVRDWVAQGGSGDRDDLVPGVSERAWRQVSVSARECLGSRCPAQSECLVEEARAQAQDADIVVTNHALLAIDAVEGRQLLPEHDCLVIDEAHDLVDRVTSAVTGELTADLVAAAAAKAARLIEGDDLRLAGESLGSVLSQLGAGRVDDLPEVLAASIAVVRDTARTVLSRLGGGQGEGPDAGTLAVARAAVADVHDVAERVLARDAADVVWLAADARVGPVLRTAPLSVAGVLRGRLFADRTVVLTSASLTVGGSFDPLAGQMGLLGDGAPSWTGLDVGSPFDYARQGIVYVAAHLPVPGRDGMGEATLDEIEALVRAAGGRTLGLFSSMRAARTAAEAMAERFDGTPLVLCQGDDQLRTLVRRFAEAADTCLFGTMSLWQGVDVPGPACQLVLIDRIPFPRPDDPLASARARAVARAGGNGFMAVSATQAALRLAQGSGRLIRRPDDRGVVAILDPRMISARYAAFLQRSLPAFWPTTDRDRVLAALGRLDAAAPDVLLPAGAPSGATGSDQRDETARRAADEGAPRADGPRTAVTFGRAWSEQEDDELRDGAELGLTVAEIARHLHLEERAVAARARMLGVVPTSPAGQ